MLSSCFGWELQNEVKMAEKSEIVKYQSDDGFTKLDVIVKSDSVWLNQSQIAELFGVKQPAISKHIKNIYDSCELNETGTYSILEYMGNDGRQFYQLKYYNLDMIIDDSQVYHIGASLKDLGKKWFAFSKMDIAVADILKKL